MKQISLIVLFFLGTTSIQAADPVKGKLIYQNGIASGKATAIIAGGLEIEIKNFPCQSCHQQDASGGYEGGVIVPPITWRALTKRPPSQQETAYDESRLIRAITQGIGSKGNNLHPLMPRYKFSEEDLENLLSYLKLQDKIPRIGITDSEIKIAVVVSQGNILKEVTSLVKKILEAYFKQVNDKGGIHGRKINLIFQSPGKLSEEVLFYTAMVAPLAELDGSTLLNTDFNGPILFPLIQVPGNIPKAVVFQASFADQLSALLVHMKSSQGVEGPANIIVDKNKLGTQLKNRVKEIDIEESNVRFLDRNVAINDGIRSNIFWFSREKSFPDFVNNIRTSGKKITLYSSIDLVGGELLKLELPDNVRLILSNPRGMPELGSEEYNEFEYFRKTHSLPVRFTEWQRISYLAATLITHTLKKAGRRLNRQNLLQSASSINSLRVGVMPAISTSTTHSKPSQILEFDAHSKSFKLLERWITG